MDFREMLEGLVKYVKDCTLDGVPLPACAAAAQEVLDQHKKLIGDKWKDPLVVVYVEGGMARYAMSSLDLDLEVIDKDNIDAGDEDPRDSDLRLRRVDDEGIGVW